MGTQRRNPVVRIIVPQGTHNCAHEVVHPDRPEVVWEWKSAKVRFPNLTTIGNHPHMRNMLPEDDEGIVGLWH